MALTPLPERIDDWSTFRQLLLETARHAVGCIEAAAELGYPPYVDPIEKAVVRAHMVRICKLLDAYVALLETGRTDSAPTLGRTMMEAVINLEYLLNSDDVTAASRGFLCRSVESLLKPVRYHEEQVEAPKNSEQASEGEIEAFMRSISPLLDLQVSASMILLRARLIGEGEDARTFLQSSAGKAALKAWPSGIASRAKGDTARAIYNIWFANGSLTTHLNWATMEHQDLWAMDDYSANCGNSILETRDAIEVPTWCVNTARRFAHMLSGNPEAVAVERELQRVEDWFLAADRSGRSEFDRVVNEVGDDIADPDERMECDETDSSDS